MKKMPIHPLLAKRREALIASGPERLAEALMELANHHPQAEAIIESLTSEPNKILEQFQAKLKEISTSGHFYSWREISTFAGELSGLLWDLEEGAEDGITGIIMMCKFFECDSAAIESCDDSGGEIGLVFTDQATKSFTCFATDVEDKDWLSRQLVKLYKEDHYGLRENLMNSASLFLPEEHLRKLVDHCWVLVDECNDGHEQRHWFSAIESLAVQLNDPALFEKTRLVHDPKPGTASCLDIAQVYLDFGEFQAALKWIEKDPDPGEFQKNKREEMLQTIFIHEGENEKLAGILWSRFRQFRSIENLQELLSVIGEDQRDIIISRESASILAQTEFRGSDAMFLLETEQIDATEKYIFKCVDQLNGEFYSTLLTLAEAMEREKRPLAASILYRSLLDSILERGYSKAYHHGVRYLEKLNLLNSVIDDWKDHSPHIQYHRFLRFNHGRKRSFWEKYEDPSDI